MDDDLDGTLFTVNDRSGIPQFEVSASGLVEISSGNLSGSATATSSFGIFKAPAGTVNDLTSSYAISASFAPSSLPSGVLSGSAQIASDISGSFVAPSASFSTRVTANETNITSLTSVTGSYATTGSNSFIGDQQITGSLTISGSFNAFRIDSDDIVLGDEAGSSMTNLASYNVLIGRNAGSTIGAGDQNVLIGNEAGYLGNQSANTSIGYLAGRGWGTTNFTPIVGYNVSIGYESAYNAATRGAGIHNTLIGSFTGRNLTSGNGNTYIGYRAGYQGAANTGNIIIGSGSEGAPAYGTPINNQLRIGNGTNHIISGSLTTGDIIFANTASAPNFSGSFQGDGSDVSIPDQTKIFVWYQGMT